VDRVVIDVRAGKGGDGIVAFRREPYVPRGGPSGGDGGRGGSITLRVDSRLTTLADFASGTLFRAEDGKPGGGNKRTGRSGKDLELHVPQGTLVSDAGTGEQMGDLTSEGQTLLVARGGTPGRGNARFATSTRQAPRFAIAGKAGEKRRISLDLKLLADAGLVGFPNAGKSTLLARVSSAKPHIGDYPFTTLNPCLGVVRMGIGSSFVMADLPGLIEGASEGVGLGLRFLRHVERTAVLVYVLSPDLEIPPAAQLDVLRAELVAYEPRLAEAGALFILAKRDLMTPDACKDLLADLPGGTLALSAATGEGVGEFLSALWMAVKEARNCGISLPPAPGQA
jgi:GTPase